MNSKERKEARYHRRRLYRDGVAAFAALEYSEPKDVFSTKAIAKGYWRCRKAAPWKASTQSFGANLFTNAYSESSQLLSGTWVPKGFHEFDIIERGKPRHIQSVKMSERCVQSALCNECLIPIIRRVLIHDNGASLKGKGTSFALNRFHKHLRWHIHRYGRNGGFYFFDFSKYFDSIAHAPLIDDVRMLVMEELVVEVYEMFINAFKGEYGLGLGSPVSQISAVFYPNSIDHWAKDTAGIHCFARYMDDGYIGMSEMNKLKECVQEFEKRCEARGIHMNKKKCRIVRLNKPFTFLKVRHFITETGKIVCRVNKDAVTKERRRLRKMRSLYDEGRKPFEEIQLEFFSWLCSLRNKKSFYVILNMIKYFNIIFSDCGGFAVPSRKNKRFIKVIRYAGKRARKEAA